MKKGEILNGYRIVEDFRVAGGRSKVTFAEKSGKVFFIKEFLAPKYPLPGSPGSEKTKERKKRDCLEFERHHKDLNSAIGRKCSFGGNLVFAVDFFRYGACYYKVTEKVDISSISPDCISRLDFDKILIISKSVAHSVKILHDLKIVHGDLKPDNILIKKVPAGYSGKLIDFDDSFFEKHPPKNREELVGTPEYYSPEQYAYISDEDEIIAGDTLTCKSDIFTLGIIFHEYFAGEKPSFDAKYGSIYSAVANGGSIHISSTIPSDDIKRLIVSMLSINAEDRPDIDEVFKTLRAARKPIGDPALEVTRGSTLRGTMLKKGKMDKVITVDAVESPEKASDIRSTEKPSGALRISKNLKLG